MSCAKRAYNYWAILVFDIFLFVFWLISFATTAVAAAAWLAVSTFDSSSSYYDYWDYDYDNTFGLDSDLAVTFGAILAASAGLGALN